MFDKGQVVDYYINGELTPISQIVINNIVDNKVVSMSGSFGGMGPFLMEFDVNTGEGIGLYSGTYIKPTTN